MAEVTVKQLADAVGAPVDRLLTQMQQVCPIKARTSRLTSKKSNHSLFKG